MSRRIPPLAVPALVAAVFAGSWWASREWRIPSFTWVAAGVPAPARAETAVLLVRGLKCRHGALPMEALLLGRSDENAIQGYLRARIFPAPGAGEMEVTFDPERTDLRRIARAVRIDRNGQETGFRVLLEEKPDLATPAALLATLARALGDQNEELFRAGHEAGAPGGEEFDALARAWEALFLEGLAPAGEPDAEGRLGLLGVVGGTAFPLGELAPGLDAIVVARGREGWRVVRAEWGRMKP